MSVRKFQFQFQFQFIGILFLIISSLSLSVSAFDQSLIAVNEGEEYTYIMEKYFLRRENQVENYTETIDYLEGDEGSIALEVGDRFTYKILNTTAFDRSTEDFAAFFPYAIKVEITSSNGTSISGNLDIGFGNILSDTNWTRYKEVIEGGRDDIEEQQSRNPDIHYIYELIDTNNEFGIKFGSVFTGNESDAEIYSRISELRYEKQTGMATLLSIEDIQIIIIEDKTFHLERIKKIVREGFSPDDNSIKLPGFTFYISITALFVLIYQKKIIH